MTPTGADAVPGAFPAKSADVHVLEITSCAATLRTMGNAVEDKTAAVKVSWDRLTGFTATLSRGERWIGRI